MQSEDYLRRFPPERFYLLKIQLLDIEPAIWRRFVVPANITLDRLHDVIQIVMGWTDSHLHEFTIGKKRYTERPQSKEEGAQEEKFRLLDLIKKDGRTFTYLYDFGDDWRHELVLEDSHFAGQELDFPITCLEGARACPPEDVGGAMGYQVFLQAMEDKGSKAHEHFVGWIGAEFDSEAFDVDAVHRELVKYLRWSRDRLWRWSLIF